MNVYQPQSLDLDALLDDRCIFRINWSSCCSLKWLASRPFSLQESLQATLGENKWTCARYTYARVYHTG